MKIYYESSRNGFCVHKGQQFLTNSVTVTSLKDPTPFSKGFSFLIFIGVQRSFSCIA